MSDLQSAYRVKHSQVTFLRSTEFETKQIIWHQPRDRLWVWFPAVPLPSSDPGQVVHTLCLCHQAVQFGPAKGRWWCSTAGKVTVGLASHWPCVTGFSGLSTYGLKGYEREMSTPPTLRRGMVDFTFFLTKGQWLSALVIALTDCDSSVVDYFINVAMTAFATADHFAQHVNVVVYVVVFAGQWL